MYIVSLCITPDNDIYYNIELQNRLIYLYIRLGDIDSDSIHPPAFYPRTINSFSNFLQSFLLNRDYITYLLYSSILLIFYITYLSLKFTPEEETPHAHCVFTYPCYYDDCISATPRTSPTYLTKQEKPSFSPPTFSSLFPCLTFTMGYRFPSLFSRPFLTPSSARVPALHSGGYNEIKRVYEQPKLPSEPLLREPTIHHRSWNPIRLGPPSPMRFTKLSSTERDLFSSSQDII